MCRSQLAHQFILWASSPYHFVFDQDTQTFSESVSSGRDVLITLTSYDIHHIICWLPYLQFKTDQNNDQEDNMYRIGIYSLVLFSQEGVRFVKYCLGVGRNEMKNLCISKGTGQATKTDDFSKNFQRGKGVLFNPQSLRMGELNDKNYLHAIRCNYLLL